jgi:hypothetical protein
MRTAVTFLYLTALVSAKTAITHEDRFLLAGPNETCAFSERFG